MNWKLLSGSLNRTMFEPDNAVLIVLASGAVFLAWMGH